METARYALGLDVGSISVSAAVVDREGQLVYEDYRRVDGRPLQAVQAALSRLRDHESLPIAAAGVTGSGRALVGAAIGADVVKNEISAHARAAVQSHPDAQTVLEIGGQDSKVTLLRKGVVVDFAMNLICAAGTGSFLDAQAKRLGISIEELGAQAMRSARPTSIAGRCTVFAESDMIHKQQIGHRQEDIVMGLCLAMARNFLSNICAGKELRPPALFQGGVSANPGMRRAFETLLDFEVIVPRHHMSMGAFGAALLAQSAAPARTKFRGCNVCEHAIGTQSFVCDDCSNECEIIEVLDESDIVGRSGGRCGKWEGRAGPR